MVDARKGSNPISVFLVFPTMDLSPGGIEVGEKQSRMTPRLWSEGVGAGLLLVELGRAVGGAGLEEKSKGSLEPRDVTGIRVELNHWPVHT